MTTQDEFAQNLREMRAILRAQLDTLEGIRRLLEDQRKRADRMDRAMRRPA